MSYRLMFTINAVVLAIFGVLFMIMPDLVLKQFGGELYAATQFIARFMGGAFLMGGLMLWLVKDTTPVKTQKNIAYVLLACSLGGFALSIFGMTAVGVLRFNGWVLLVIYGFFSLLYGYALFLQPKNSEAKSRSPRKPKDTPATNSG